MKRRAVLAAGLGVGTSVGLPGCVDEDDGDGIPDGEWELRVVVANEDDGPREWRVECRSQDAGTVVAASGTLPAGESTESVLRGQRRDDRKEVYVEADAGAVSEPWRPAECPRLLADVGIVGGEPRVETECRLGED